MSPRSKFFDRRSEDSTSSRTFSVDCEEPRPLLEKDVFFNDQDRLRPRASRWWYWGKVVAVYVSPWLLVLALSIALLQTRYNRRISAEDGLERYSPIPVESIEYHDVVFDRAFGANARWYSDYSGRWPDNELDDRWDALYNHAFTGMSKASNAKLLNKTMRTPVEGFQDTHMGTLDVFHQLHCLNLIRKSFYPNRYNTSLFADDGETLVYVKWIHMDHCIDSIRQSLMCSADVAVMGYEWFENEKMTRGRFNSVHRCRDWSQIRQWAEENWVPFPRHHAHVDEETGTVIDYGVDVDHGVVKDYEPAWWPKMKSDM